MKIFTKSIILLLFVIYGAAAPLVASKGESPIGVLKDLSLRKNSRLKQLRNDVRKSIYVIKSRRPENELPDLAFYQYRVKRGETFWKILSKTSLDMDTLISVNRLSTPQDVMAGRKIFIPNMRGIIMPCKKARSIAAILKKNRIQARYLYRINKNIGQDKKYLFVPCGKLSNLERSLFLGTGFMYPLKGGRRTSGFGMRRDPFNHSHAQFHPGVDIACRRGSKVYAARGGTVMFAGYKGGYGMLVILKHEHRYRTYYGHLSRAVVKPGQHVERGQVIALSGNTGRTTGPHLHFEVRKGARPINPGVLIKR